MIDSRHLFEGSRCDPGRPGRDCFIHGVLRKRIDEVPPQSNGVHRPGEKLEMTKRYGKEYMEVPVVWLLQVGSGAERCYY